jgi:hypothetical protein
MADEVELPQKIKDQIAEAKPPDPKKWTWGSSAVEQVEETVVEVDEAIEADVWRLLIDMPGCYVSFQIEGRKQLAELVEFLGRADQPDSLGQIGELGFGRPETSWVWDDETPRRLFIWLNRADPSSMRATLNPQQVNCIRLALTEAGKTSS